MIQGFVTPERDPVIMLLLRGKNGCEERVTAVVDTGFRGSLTLPPDVVARMAFPLGAPTEVILAGNVREDFDVVEATLVWDGQPRDVSALQASGDVLVGMSLLRGYRVTVEDVDNGKVLIEKMA